MSSTVVFIPTRSFCFLCCARGTSRFFEIKKIGMAGCRELRRKAKYAEEQMVVEDVVLGRIT